MKKLTYLFPIVALVTALFVSFSSVARAQSVTFTAAGDYANGGNFQAAVAAAKGINPAFHLALGDLAYTTAEASWCGAWKTAGVNLMLVSGNHDSGESSSGNINTYIANCLAPAATVTGTYGKQYYWDYPASNPYIRFIMISPGLGGSFVGMDTNYKVGSQGYTFTANAIDDAHAKGIKWVVVGMHKNYISMMEKGNELGADLIPMMINKRVDVILQGHEHGYERSKQLTCAKTGTFDSTCVVNSGNSLTKGAGTIIHVIGTGGQSLRSLNTGDAEAQYFNSYDITTYGIGKFVVTPTQMTYSFVRTAGGTFGDSFTISDNGGPVVTPPPTTPATASPTPRPATATPIPQPTATATPRAATPTPTVTANPTSTPVACNVNVTGLPSATLTATNVTAGTYAIWTRMMSAGTASNAYYLQVDSTCPAVIGDNAAMPVNSWQWIDYRDGVTTNRTITALGAGTHTFKLIQKEAGVKIDTLLLLANTACIPTGLGTNCNAITPTPTTIATATPFVTPIPTVVPTSTPNVTPFPTATPFGTPTVTPQPTATPSPTTRPTATPVATTPPGDGDNDDIIGKLLYPTHDATVNQSAGNTNYGKATTLEVDNSPRKEVYLKFDLDGISSSKIHSAVLKLTATSGSANGMSVYWINNTSWGENILTWNSRPSITRQKIGTFNGNSVDLTSLFRSRAGKVTSIVIASDSTSGVFRSAEASSGKAMLIIK